MMTVAELRRLTADLPGKARVYLCVSDALPLTWDATTGAGGTYRALDAMPCAVGADGGINPCGDGHHLVIRTTPKALVQL